MHPETDRHLAGRVGRAQPDVHQVRHERLAGREDFSRLGRHVHRQSDVAAQLVGDNVEGRLEDSGNRGNRAALVAQALDLRTEGVEVGQHRHAALHQREVVAVGRRLADARDFSRDAREPDIVEESGRIVDQDIVLILTHEGAVLRRLDVVEAGRVRNADAGNAIVPEPRRLREAGPDIDHVRHHRIPIEVLRTLDGRLEGAVVVMRDLLAGHAGVSGGELRHKRADRDPVGLLVAQRGKVAAEPFAIELGGIHDLSRDLR